MVSPLLRPGEGAATVVLVGGSALLVLLLWLGWRKPTGLLMIALAALALHPQLFWGGPDVSYEWGLQQSLISLALALNALRYGVRKTINWPILALTGSFVLATLLGDLHPKLTLPFMLESLAILALPFTFTQVVLAPGSRRAYALIIMLTPLLSVALGGLLQLAEIRTVFSYERWVEDLYRLEGATGNAAVFATLAFAGFAVALHEWTRPARPFAGYLASLNLVLVILSGTRMAIFASAVLVASYAWTSSMLRERLRQNRKQSLIGLALVVAIVIAYLPILTARMFEGDQLQLSSRDMLWSFYYQEFLLSPMFGRGFGAGFIAGADWVNDFFPIPHNEYLHLLVIGGVLGLVLCIGGIVLWYRQLLRAVSPNDREFLLALAPAVAVYVLTDNLLIYPTAFALYAYLGILLTKSLSVIELRPEELAKILPYVGSPAGSGQSR